MGSQAPRFQSWAGLAPLGKETSIGSLGTLLPEQGWAAEEMPPRSGRNQPVHLLLWRPGRARQLRGPRVAGERSPRLAVPGGLLGWAGDRRSGKDLLGKGSPFAFTCHRDPARRSPRPPAVGSALSRLWRSTRRVELAPHVAGRASFTQPSREEGERSGSEAHVTGALEY